MKIVMYGRLDGGAKTCMISLFKRLKRSYHIELLCENNLSVLKAPLGSDSYCIDGLKAIKTIRKLVDKDDIFHIHHTATSSELFVPYFKQECNIVNTFHVPVGNGVEGGKGTFLLHFYAMLYRKRSRKFIGVAYAQASLLKKYKEDVEVVPNGVDIEEFRPFETSRYFNDFTVGYLGRLSNQKNIHSLIKACRELDVNLVIGGTGPLYSKMKENENEKLKVLGYVENTAFFLNSIDLFVLPSYTEACPITLLEAMACGKPVIATDVGDNQVLVKEEWGRLCSPNIESIKTAISEMKRNDLKNMGKKARKFVTEKYTWDYVTQKYESIYKEVTQGPHLS